MKPSRTARLLAACLLFQTPFLSAAERPSPVAVKGFPEVLLPAGAPDAGQAAALGEAAAAFGARKAASDFSAWETYLEQNPASPWKIAILTNMGLGKFQQSRFSECLAHYEAAWQAGKANQDPALDPLVGRAVGELAMMYGRLGRYESLKALFAELGDRSFRGPGGTLLDDARTGYSMMERSPEVCFRCGPLAVSRILSSKGVKDIFPAAIRDSVSTRDGISFDKVRDIASQSGLEYQVAKRAPGAEVIVPSVVHWKVGHYAALVRGQGGDTYVVEDPTFAAGTSMLAEKAVLDAEGSGYYLVPAGALPPGWTEVADAEAATVFGKGQTGGSDPNATKPDDKTAKPDSGGDDCGMAVWNFHLLLASLNIHDMPLAYEPPVGPAVMIRATYNSRENQSFTTATHTNFGPKWNLSSIAYLTDSGTSVSVQGGQGGSETYQRDPNNPLGWLRSPTSYSKIEKLSVGHYERTFVDGSKEVYNAAGPTGALYRTELVQATGRKLTFTYSIFTGGIRLSTITDGIGQVTTLEYAGGGSVQPVKITDPFGRFATFAYDADGRLTSITDPVGMTSSFSYKANSDFIEKLTTPYGDTRFAGGQIGTTRWIEATHPNGDIERAEFRHFADGINPIPTAEERPQGMETAFNYMHFRNAFYWDRKASRMAAGDISKAELTHFLHTTNVNVASGLVESEKKPLEGRVWYNYQNQGDPIIEPPNGQSRRTRIGRIMDDGSTQLLKCEYNEAGKVTEATDPAGRKTVMIYAANMRDLLELRQVTGAGTYDKLGEWTYNAAGLPLTMKDPAGRVTTLTYNADGQPLTVTDTTGAVTAFTYNANGYLMGMDGPLPGTSDAMTFTYDAAGRVASVSDAPGLSKSYLYDNLNRPTRITDADGEYVAATYDRMQIKTIRDRGGRTTTYTYDSLQKVIESVTPEGLKTYFEWCKCGALQGLFDSKGNVTRYEYDVQGRNISKTLPNGGKITIEYQPLSGRAWRITDERGVVRTASYTQDNRIAGFTFSGPASATPPKSFTWDPIYPRMSSFTDGTGTTQLSYNAVALGQNGVGQLAAVDGPLADDTISYTYDSTNRVTGRTIGTAGNVVSRNYGTGDRLQTLTNALGSFTYNYADGTNRLSSIAGPNGLTTSFTYQAAPGVKLLRELTHTGAAGAAISKYTYNFDARLLPTSITRQNGTSAALQDTPSYDARMRLTGYQQSLAGGGTKNYSYTYDELSNRQTETIDGSTATSLFNVVNQLSSRTPADLPQGTYEWDATGRISAIVRGNLRTEIGYDALGRRARIVEKNAGSTVQDRRFIWDGMELAEERNAAGAVVKRFFPQGFTTSAGAFYYLRDRLGSITQLVDATGAVRANYIYDPYGRRAKFSGDMDCDLGYTGHWTHAGSGLVLTWARAYDPALGRWLSRDPVGEMQGVNLYAYLGGNPLAGRDPSGLAEDSAGAGTGDAAAGGEKTWNEKLGEALAHPGVGMALGGIQVVFSIAAISAAVTVGAPVLGAFAVAAGIGVIWNGWGMIAPALNWKFGTEFSGGVITDTVSYFAGGLCDNTKNLLTIADLSVNVASGVVSGNALGAAAKANGLVQMEKTILGPIATNSATRQAGVNALGNHTKNFSDTANYFGFGVGMAPALGTFSGSASANW